MGDSGGDCRVEINVYSVGWGGVVSFSEGRVNIDDGGRWGSSFTSVKVGDEGLVSTE